MTKLIVALAALLMTSCASYGPMLATGNNGRSKMGQACNQWIIADYPILTWGRNDIVNAADSGKITKISVVDTERHNYLLYGTVCTNVYGE